MEGQDGGLSPGRDLVGVQRKWAEAPYASTERVTSSNEKGAKSMAILLHLRCRCPRDLCPEQPAFCCVPNTKGESVSSGIPSLYLSRPSASLWLPQPGALRPGSQGPSPSAGAPHSLLMQLSAECGLERPGIQDPGFGEWGWICSMHGGVSAWVEGSMRR